MVRVGVISSTATSLKNVAQDIATALRHYGHNPNVITRLISPIDGKLMFDKSIIITVFSPISIPSWFTLWQSLNSYKVPSKLYVTVEGEPKQHLVYDWIKRDGEFIANSYFTKAMLEQQDIRVADVVYHGIDMALINKAKTLNPPINKPSGKVLFGFVANDQVRKGHDKLAQVIQLAKEKVPEAHFYVLTQPSAARYYAGLENVHVNTSFGTLAREQVLSIIGAFDFYLSVSLSEGFCLPQIEAQAMGVPVLYLDYAPLNETVDPKNNIPIPYKTIDKIDIGHGILYTLHLYDPLEVIEAIKKAVQLRSDKKAYSAMKRSVTTHARKFDILQVYKPFS